MMRRQTRKKRHQWVLLSPIFFLSVSSLCLGLLSILLVRTVVAEEEIGVDGEIVSPQGKDVQQQTNAEEKLLELTEIADLYGEKQVLEYTFGSDDDDEETSGELDWQVVERRVLEMDRYMKERQESATESLRDCRNLHEHCIAMASLKSCGTNPDYMLENCAPSCRTCDGSLEELPAHDLVLVYGVPQLGLLEEQPDIRYDHVASRETLESFVRDMHEYMTQIDMTEPSQNKHENCVLWAIEGNCETLPEYMKENCAPSCRTREMTEQSLLEEEPNVELYGVPQKLIENKLDAATAQNLLNKMNNYMRDVVFGNDSYASVRETCLNEDENCLYWSHVGECDNSTTALYMQIYCAPACGCCEKKGSYEFRCGHYASGVSEDIWKHGDVDRMFERITSDTWFVEQYKPTILGGPGIKAKIDGKENQPTPWIVTLDNFLTEEECAALIELGAKQGYERSMVVADDDDADGSKAQRQKSTRTSSTTWCLPPCFEDPVAKKVLEKIEFATGVPDKNSEYLQLLRYMPGEFYEEHHDYITYSTERLMGPRIVTVFLYLSNVEAGGGTRFTDLDLTVMPKRGTALIWQNVLNDHPNERDDRTYHEALPVEQGVKFGANAWLHQRDFKFAYSKNCHF